MLLIARSFPSPSFLLFAFFCWNLSCLFAILSHLVKYSVIFYYPSLPFLTLIKLGYLEQTMEENIIYWDPNFRHFDRVTLGLTSLIPDTWTDKHNLNYRLIYHLLCWSSNVLLMDRFLIKLALQEIVVSFFFFVILNLKTAILTNQPHCLKNLLFSLIEFLMAKSK